MSGKGIADLRAKFENQTKDTSPPSRGRSPVGQEYVTGSGNRKIRTSFISVERSALVGSLEDQRESIGSDEEQVPMANGANGTKAGMNGDAMGPLSSNGVGSASGSVEEVKKSGDKAEGPAASKAGNGTLAPEEAAGADAVNPDKPVAASEERVSTMQPSDPKDEEAVSGGAALAPEGKSLGALLKGSEFEPEKEKSSKNASPKKPSALSNPSTPKKTRSPQKPTPGPSKVPTTPKMNGSPRSKPGSARPSPLKKPEEPSPATPAEKSSPVYESSPDAPQTPTSPTAAKSPIEQSLPKAISPESDKKESDELKSEKPEGPPQTAKEGRMKAATTHKPLRPSTGIKPAPSAAPKSTKPKPSAAASVPKASKPNSPSTTKPRPRSPTRPVRLPGAAIASTAASAAKTGITAPSQPSSRASLSNSTKPSTSNKPTGTKVSSKPAQPTAPALRNKAPRSSLPAAMNDPKPKSRTSTASTKATGGDFLARMMRPTQSSASKTHEKVEQKTPPKKRISSRPKRISDEDGKEADNKAMQEASVQDELAAGAPPQGQASGKFNHMDPTTIQADVAKEATKEPLAEEGAEASAGEAAPQATEPVFGP